MLACPSCLNLMVQFIDVISNRQQDTLGGDICFSTIQIPSELHILFDVRKAVFRLDTPVHPQLCPVFAGNPFQCLLPFFFHLKTRNLLLIRLKEP